MEVVGLCSAMAAATTAKQLYHNYFVPKENTSEQKGFERFTLDIETFVSDIIDKKVNLSSLDENIITQISVDERKEYSDETMDLKSVCTSIVTNELLHSSENMHLFLMFVIGSFEDSIDHYCTLKNIERKHIQFLYKSGNILRLISNHFLRYLSQFSMLEQEMEQYFKKGDCDFTIYINPSAFKKRKFNSIHSDMTTLSYILNKQLRKIFMQDIEETFTLTNYKMKYQQRVLAKYISKFNELECFSDPENKELHGWTVDNISFFQNQNYTCPDDQHIQFSSPNLQNITVYSHGKNPDQFIYVQCNRALRFYKSKTDIAHFNLIRSKVNFVLDLSNEQGGRKQMSIGGELIDVSIPHYEDPKLSHFFSHLKDNVHNYTIETKECCPLHFYSVSFSYQIYDLEQQVFGYVIDGDTMPWEKKKFNKRIHRLLFLYYMDLYRNQNLVELGDIFDCLVHIAECIQAVAAHKMPDFTHFEHKGKYTTVSFGKVCVILHELSKYIVPENEEKFHDFIVLIMNDIHTFSVSVQNTINFCEKNTRFYFTEDLYEHMLY